MVKKTEADIVVKHPRSFSDAMPTLQFHPELERIELAELIGRPVVVVDAVVRTGCHSKYGVSDFALLKIKDEGQFYTTICGGVVVIDKITRALEENMLPLTGTIIQVPSKTRGHSAYYDIV